MVLLWSKEKFTLVEKAKCSYLHKPSQLAVPGFLELQLGAVRPLCPTKGLGGISEFFWGWISVGSWMLSHPSTDIWESGLSSLGLTIQGRFRHFTADVFILTLLDISLLWQLSLRLYPHLLSDFRRLTRVFPVTGWEVPGSMELLRSVALAKSKNIALLLLASALNLEWRWGWLTLCPGST